MAWVWSHLGINRAGFSNCRFSFMETAWSWVTPTARFCCFLLTWLLAQRCRGVKLSIAKQRPSLWKGKIHKAKGSGLRPLLERENPEMLLKSKGGRVQVREVASPQVSSPSPAAVPLSLAPAPQMWLPNLSISPGLSCFGKVLKNEELKEFRIINTWQHSFRKNRSCQTNLNSFFNITKIWAVKDTVNLAFSTVLDHGLLDTQLSFYHCTLLRKLMLKGCSSRSQSWSFRGFCLWSAIASGKDNMLLNTKLGNPEVKLLLLEVTGDREGFASKEQQKREVVSQGCSGPFEQKNAIMQ